ncbi:hypothetical protein [Bacillus cereus group sp. MYBK139-2]|uniref:hypothetical protein n=1 Tax=unclassified Bacillus cereus group TaxID=2750818 RepID=UPI003F78EAE3
MVTLYYVQDKSREFVHPVDGLLYSDKNQLEDKMKRLTNGFVTMYENNNYEVKSMEVSEKCLCDDYMHTTMILIEVKEDKSFRFVGSDNYIGMHEKVRLPLDIDIEKHTNGRYQLMSEEYFHKHHEIKER